MNALFSYSLLSVIREKSTNIKSLVDLFREYTETILSIEGFNGKGTLLDLRPVFEKYGLTIPVPTLKSILLRIHGANKESFVLHDDFSFIFPKNLFVHDRQEIDKLELEIEELDFVYVSLCKDVSIRPENTLQYFIDSNKEAVVQFLSGHESAETTNSEHFRVFKTLWQNPAFKGLIERLVAGATLSAYLEIPTVDVEYKKTLVLDTNFLVSLSDLHSSESYLTATELLGIAKKSRYFVCVFPSTIKEYKSLLARKAESNRQVTIFTATKRESIEYGCQRRGLRARDLDLYVSKIEQIVRQNGISILDQATNQKYENKAPRSDFYRSLKDRAWNPEGALHDAMVLCYVRDQWQGTETRLSDAPAFFVTDTQGYLENKITSKAKLPYVVRADDLLNLLWLASPQANTTMAKIHLSRMSISYFEKSLPQKDLLRRLDEKVNRIKDLDIRPSDCVEIALNLALIDTRELQTFADAEEESVLKAKIADLAIVAQRLSQQEQQENQKRIGSMVEHIDEFRRTRLAEMEHVVEVEKEKASIQLAEMESRYNVGAMKERKRSLEQLVARDKETLLDLQGEHSTAVTRLDRWTKGLAWILTLLLSGAFGAGTWFLLVPFWSVIEPVSYGVSLFVSTALLLWQAPKRRSARSLVEGTSMKLIRNSALGTRERVLAEKIQKVESRIALQETELSELMV
jgi:hypothetical protein